jgi:cation transport ATPase
VTDVEEIAGQGIRAKVNGKVVCVGNKKMMENIGAKWHDCNQVGTIIHVAIDGKYAGHIVINDTLKGGSAHAIRELKEDKTGRQDARLCRRWHQRCPCIEACRCGHCHGWTG